MRIRRSTILETGPWEAVSIDPSACRSSVPSRQFGCLGVGSFAYRTTREHRRGRPEARPGLCRSPRHLPAVCSVPAVQHRVESPHLCRSTKTLDEATAEVPVFPPIDQWGALPFPLVPMTPHSLSRRVRDLLAGDLGAHRHLPVDRDEAGDTDNPIPVPLVERRVYSKHDSARAWARRRADLKDLAGIDDLLAEVDRRVDDMNRLSGNLSGVD